MNYLKRLKSMLNFGLKQYPKDSFEQSLIRRASNCERFVLPEHGVILDDDFKGLYDVDVPRLPYPEVSLLFDTAFGTEEEIRTGRGTRQEAITFVQEMTEGEVMEMSPAGTQFVDLARRDGEFKSHMASLRSQLNIDDSRICLVASTILNFNGKWVPIPATTVMFSKLTREGMNFEYKNNERNQFKPVIVHSFDRQRLTHLSVLTGRSMQRAIGIAQDIMNNSAVVPTLELVEALSCSNVAPVRNRPSNVMRSLYRHAALKDDSFHVLEVQTIGNSSSVGNGDSFVVGGDRHRPREHLRRGHIKLVACGKGRTERKKVWINSVLVNAGVGGKLTKDYDVKKAA